MKIAFFNAKAYDRSCFDEANQQYGHDIRYLSPHLNAQTAALISDETAVCVFINDTIDAAVIKHLNNKGIKLIALRSAGFNHVDLHAAKKLALPVVRVPAYSPFAIAEHAVGLLLCLNRKIHRAFNRVREGDFSVNGLMGIDLHGKTVGVIGTGKIGQAFASIMLGFGCHVIAFNPKAKVGDKDNKFEYVSLATLFAQSDVISLHCPLTNDTHHLINQHTLSQMKTGVAIINTSRGKLIHTADTISALKTGKIGMLGLDVYEEEEDIFFENLSSTVIQDDQLSRLLTFPNVIVTSHQAFFTQEAMHEIAHTTLRNISEFEQNDTIVNEVKAND